MTADDYKNKITDIKTQIKVLKKEEEELTAQRKQELFPINRGSTIQIVPKKDVAPWYFNHNFSLKAGKSYHVDVGYSSLLPSGQSVSITVYHGAVAGSNARRIYKINSNNFKIIKDD